MSDTWTTEFQPIILAAMVRGDALAGITATDLLRGNRPRTAKHGDHGGRPASHRGLAGK